MDNTKWLIWSIEQERWWKSNQNGYTEELEEAGVYTYDAACRIVMGANYLLTLQRQAHYLFNKPYNTPKEAMILVTSQIAKNIR